MNGQYYNKESFDKYFTRPCSDKELERRWEAAANAMKAKDVDYLIAIQRTDYNGCYVKWFTDGPVFWEYTSMIIFSQAKEITTVWHGSPRQKEMPPDYACRGVVDKASTGHIPSLNYTCIDPAVEIVNKLKNKGRIRVGFVGLAFISVQAYQYLLENLKNAEFVDMTDDIDFLMACKSDEEIEMIRESCKLQDDVLDYLCKWIQPGITEADLFAELKAQCFKRGAENGVFILGSGNKNGPVPGYFEHFHSKKVIEKDDAIWLCIECNGPSGMYANISRTLVFGDLTDDMVKAQEIYEKVLMYHLDNVRPGKTPQELLKIHNEYMISIGQPPEDRLLSHGQGYSLVERPAVVPRETMPITPNMNITAHPTVLVGNACMNATENWVVPKDGGPLVCLNKCPRGYISI